jgi:hypothetical protein
MEPTNSSSYISMDDNATNADALMTSAKPPIRICRRFNVQISGSMQDFESMGKTAATWAPVGNCHAELFGAELDSVGSYGNDTSAITNAIGNAVVVKATMLQSKSTFPVALGLTMNGVPCKEWTDTGEKFLTTILPEHTSTTPEVLFEADITARQGLEWRSLYPQYNATNLEKQGVVRNPTPCSITKPSTHKP